MNKITLLSALFLSASGFAQITYDSTDFATAGEEFTVSTANPSLANFAATGAGYDWDFSNLTAASQATTGWQNPNNSGYKLSWCLSHFYLFNCNSQFGGNFKLASPVMDDIAIGDYTISNIVEHTDVSSDGLVNRMRGMTTQVAGIPLPLTIDYDDPDEIYNFPMVFNDTYANSGHFAIDLNNVGVDFNYSLSTTRTNTVQGWGSLTTPMGTFSDVLKIKCVTQRTDQVSVAGITIPIPTTTISYQWFSKEHGIPVLQADGIELFNFFIPTSVKYLDEIQCLTAAADFSYIPTADFDAETMMGTMAFTNLSENYSAVDWDFGDGTAASGETNPTHFYKCPGTYTVTLTVNNTVCAPNSSATAVYPVVVTDTQNVMTTGVTVNETGLTADRDIAGTTYQWVDCDNQNTAIEGATDQTFTPSVSGNFACMLDTGGCTGMSECRSFTLLGNSLFNLSNVQLYPNPTTGQLHLTGNLTVKSVAVYNALGMTVAKSFDISSLATGMYIVKIDTDAGTLVRKVFKK